MTGFQSDKSMTIAEEIEKLRQRRKELLSDLKNIYDNAEFQADRIQRKINETIEAEKGLAIEGEKVNGNY